MGNVLLVDDMRWRMAPSPEQQYRSYKMSVEADMSESLADRKSVWSGVEDELRALIVAPDDIDSVGVTTNQGVARRALLHIAELKAHLADAQATIERLTKGD